MMKWLDALVVAQLPLDDEHDRPQVYFSPQLGLSDELTLQAIECSSGSLSIQSPSLSRSAI